MANVTAAQVLKPNGFAQGQPRLQMLYDKSDEFNQAELNLNKWVSAPKDLVIGAWTFVPENTFIRDGKLQISVTQQTHTRWFNDSCWDGKAGGSAKKVARELYYKSGALKSKSDTVYGFYEAKIKGVKLFPGLSPAFWLYSDGHPYSDRDQAGSVDYSEIDVVELQQADWHGPGVDDADPINVTDHNLHARIVAENGQTYWRRPKPYPDEQLLQYQTPFDPSKGFHTYAVENRQDRIFWYVDGKLIGSKKNLYWHRPMHVIFSMGLRRQLIKYNAACQRADPNPATVTQKGFPDDATMAVDYVRSWQILPSIWLANADQIRTMEQSTTQPLVLDVHYHAGSNHSITAGNYGGLRVNLLEKGPDGYKKVVSSKTMSSVLSEDKKFGGQLTVSIPTATLMPSEQLKPGHDYYITAVFKSSNGKNIYLNQSVGPIKIVK
ncbi:family 16 glycosylhydrolase [Gayadomonas joobiniege]|uniref:family 16 glycosylhydrolase n=1 Tax=Gayadomonas joobiniege TaxID=1234606 RepID=UPI00138AC2CC|nr:family 16 glycosylhydrolase [Gayadomonas joobiniege]